MNDRHNKARQENKRRYHEHDVFGAPPLHEVYATVETDSAQAIRFEVDREFKRPENRPRFLKKGGNFHKKRPQPSNPAEETPTMQEALDLDQDGELDGVSHAVLRAARDAAKAKKVWWLKIEDQPEGFLVRRPSTDEFDRVIAASSAQGNKFSVESRNLARACVLYPDRPTFMEMTLEQAGLGLTLAGKIMELAGLSRSVDAKKA